MAKFVGLGVSFDKNGSNFIKLGVQITMDLHVNWGSKMVQIWGSYSSVLGVRVVSGSVRGSDFVKNGSVLEVQITMDLHVN